MDIKETVNSLAIAVEFNEGVVIPTPGPSTAIKVESNLFNKSEADRLPMVGGKSSECLNRVELGEVSEVKCEKIINRTFANVKIEQEVFDSCVSVERTDLVNIKKEVDDVAWQSTLLNECIIPLIEPKDVFIENSDLDQIKREINSFTLKSELLNEEYDIPIVKNEAEFLDQPCSSKHFQHSLKQRSTKIKKRKLKYSCPVCCKNFIKASARNAHFNRHFGKYNVTCFICGTLFHRQQELRNHLFLHFTKKLSVINKRLDYHFKCKVCPKLFVDKLNLTIHMTTHVILERKVRNAKTHSKNKSVKHSKKRIHPKGPFKCHICLNQFTRKDYLIRHIRLHTAKNLIRCIICCRYFTQTENIIQHIVRVHIGNECTCEICSQQFAENADLIKHYLEVHTEDKPFKCETCIRRFTTEQQLYLHKQSHSDSVSQLCACQICSKQFRGRKNLLQHMRTHSKVKMYKCEICSKSIGNTNNFLRHMKLHTGDKPFVCHICSKQFALKFYLLNHVQTHVAEKPFKCEYCVREFVKESSLENHMKEHTPFIEFLTDNSMDVIDLMINCIQIPLSRYR